MPLEWICHFLFWAVPNLYTEMKSKDGVNAMFHVETMRDVQKVNPMEVEEGEIVDMDSQNGVMLSIGDNANSVYQGSRSMIYRSKKKKMKKKKKRRNKSNSEPNLKDIDRFVSDVCKRLKERKSYMVYMAVGCLGISAMNQLVKEVYAVQACGGQKTSDGRHYRSGGGIMWNLLKSKDHNAYKYIMKRAKKFEKQFRSVCSVRKDANKVVPVPFPEVTRVNQVVVVGSGNMNQVKINQAAASVDEMARGGGVSEGLELEACVQSQFERLNLQKPLSSIPEEEDNAGHISDDLELESHVRNQLELMHIEKSALELEI